MAGAELPVSRTRLDHFTTVDGAISNCSAIALQLSPEAIAAAIGIEPTHPSLEALKGRALVRHKIVADAAAIRDFIESRAI